MSALLAVMVLSVLGASSASAALPEFIPGKGVKFTSTASELIIYKSGRPFAGCPKGSIAGEIVGAKEVRARLKYEYGSGECGLFCEDLRPSFESRELKGTLGYIDKKEHAVGILFTAVEEPFAKCEYPGYHGTLTGSFIARIEGLNIHQKGPFPLSLPNVQAEHFEGEVGTHTLKRESIPFEYTGSLSLTMSEVIDIAA